MRLIDAEQIGLADMEIIMCDGNYKKALEMLIDKIANAPSIDAVKHGVWEIYVISMFDGEGCRCSECGFEGVPYWDFCPNCGADMRERKES